MKAAWYETNGSAANVLTVGVMPDPHPGEGEVRVRLHASGVNPSDVKSRAGRPLSAPRIVPHGDGAGVIDEVGPGVLETRLGERVWIWNGQWKRPFGTAAEFIALPHDQAVALAPGTSFEEGACLGILALTALRAMTVDGAVAGRSVLITGGAGAVGAHAIQFARLLGAAKVITTVSPAEEGDLARALGADAFVNYRTEDVAARVGTLTSGDGADRIVEVDASGNAKLLPPAGRARWPMRRLRIEPGGNRARPCAHDRERRGRAVLHCLSAVRDRADRDGRGPSATCGQVFSSTMLRGRSLSTTWLALMRRWRAAT